MQKPFAKRIDNNKRRQARASSVFERLSTEFETVSVEQREVYDELQVEIDALRELQEEALNSGLRATEQAKRVRDLVV